MARRAIVTFRAVATAAFLLAAADIASAQSYPGGRRGGGSEGPGGRPGAGSDLRSGFALPSARDVEREDPVSFLLGKARDLSLADSQVTRLAAIDAKLMGLNRVALRKIDSVQTDLRPAVEGSGAPSEGERARAASGRHAFAEAMYTIRGNYDAATQEALAVLTDAQKKRAAGFLDERRNSLKKMIGGAS